MTEQVNCPKCGGDITNGIGHYCPPNSPYSDPIALRHQLAQAEAQAKREREKGMWDGIRLACRQVCQWCYEDGPPVMNDSGTWVHKGTPGYEPTLTCKASAILDVVRRTPPGTLGWTTEGESDEPVAT